MSREALLSAVWSGVVVGDDALTQAVVKLRKALGDAAPGDPAYIQTISKGGYRLVAPVLVSDAHPSDRRTVPVLWLTGVAAVLFFVGGGWWFTGEPSLPSGQSVGSGQPAHATQPTVAIRPFEPVGNDPQEALLARGITADLVTDLSKMSGLWVMRVGPASRRAADALPADASPADAPPIRYLVSGTVQRAGERVRLQVHLADAQTGKQLWSERFDRALTGLFEIQDELGPKIVRVLPVKLSEAESRRIAQRYTRNFEAYDTFQRGLSALHVRRKAENDSARGLFRRAIALDAGFARAYAGTRTP